VTDALTVCGLCNRFLTSKRRLMEADELSPRTWRDYSDCCETIVDSFGKMQAVVNLTTENFAQLRSDLAKVRGPAALGNQIQRIRTVFKFAFDADLIERPVRFGPTFRKPSRKFIHKALMANGTKMIEATEGGATSIDSVGLQFEKLMKALDLTRAESFYNLRHTFRTVAGGSKDQPAVTIRYFVHFCLTRPHRALQSPKSCRCSAFH